MGKMTELDSMNVREVEKSIANTLPTAFNQDYQFRSSLCAYASCGSYYNRARRHRAECWVG